MFSLLMILTCYANMYVQITVNRELEHGWLYTNTLSINLTRTNVMSIKTNTCLMPRLNIDNHLIELTDYTLD